MRQAEGGCDYNLGSTDPHERAHQPPTTCSPTSMNILINFHEPTILQEPTHQPSQIYSSTPMNVLIKLHELLTTLHELLINLHEHTPQPP